MSHDITTRLVQLTHPEDGRRTALVHREELHLLATYRSVYAFARAALELGSKLRDLLSTDLSGIVLDYNEVDALRTPWRFLPAFDDPAEPARCLVSSLEPAWQYIGSGDCLLAHGDARAIPGLPAAVPVAELAAAYIIGSDGEPRRVGVAAASGAALGPELVLDAEAPRIEGAARVIRAGREVWSQAISAGDAPLALALASVEPDHFRCAGHRRPGCTHVLFFGAKLLGAVDRPTLEDGDEVTVEWNGFGHGLRTTIQAEKPARRSVAAIPL